MGVGRVDFRPELFDRLIDEKGYNLTHQKAILCTCLDPTTRQPDPTCSLCRNGWQYYGDEEIKGVISGVTNEKQFVETGGAMLGTMQLTVKAETVLGYHDRIIHTDSIVNFSEALVKQAGATDPLRFDAVSGLRLIGPDGVYGDGDYSLSGNTLTWLCDAADRPSEGESFSVAYTTHPAWLVMNFLHMVRDTTVKFRQRTPQNHRLPLQVLCKLEWLVED